MKKRANVSVIVGNNQVNFFDEVMVVQRPHLFRSPGLSIYLKKASLLDCLFANGRLAFFDRFDAFLMGIEVEIKD